MATIKQGYLGGFSGKLGGAIGTSWKGINVVRSMPQSVMNPRTTSQVNNRNRFGAVSKLASELLSTFIKPLWDRTAQGMSGYNAFCHANKSAFDDTLAFDSGAFILSKGKLGMTNITKVQYQSSDELEVAFDKNLDNAFKMSNDKMYALIIDDYGKVLGYSAGVVDRSVGTLMIKTKEPLPAQAHFTTYLTSKRADGTAVGDSYSIYGEI